MIARPRPELPVREHGLDIRGPRRCPLRCRRARPACNRSSCAARRAAGPGATFHTTASAVTIEDPTAAAGGRRRGAGGWTLGSRGPADNRQRQGQLGHREDLGNDRLGLRTHGMALPVHEPTAVRRPGGPHPASHRSRGLRAPAGARRRPGRSGKRRPTPSTPLELTTNRQSGCGPSSWAAMPGDARTASPSAGRHRPRPTLRSLALGTSCADQQACSVGSVDGPGVDTVKGLTAGESGDFTLQVWLEDEAGNQSYALSASDAVHLRLDQEPPRLVFQPQDPGDPLRVAVHVDDRHSGLDTGAIEMRRRGGDVWQSLATVREDQLLVSYVDDERFRSGVYDFRAGARDRAGNESSTDRQATGARATIELPVRFATRLSVGRPHRARRGKRRTIVLAPSTRAKYRTRLKLHGRLANADGQPIGGATVQVSSDSPGDAVGLLPAGVARTDREGRFTYVVRATRNKVLRFRYSGSRQIRAASGDFELHVPGRSSIRAQPKRLRNGQSVRLSGRVATRPLPPVREAGRGSGLLPGAFPDLLDHSCRRHRSVALRLSLRGHTRAGALPPARTASRRGRVPVRHRSFARHPRGGQRTVGFS